MAAQDGGEQITHVLFCGSNFPTAEIYTREYLQGYPFIQVDVVPHDDVAKVIENYHICVPKIKKLDSDIISRAKNLKLILQFGVGMEGIDINAATTSGIKVARIPSDTSGNAASCSEMAIYLMLGLLRKQNDLQRSIKQRKLGVPIGETLLGKTVFILGFGNIGVELAKRLKPFGVKIIATKRRWDSSSHNSEKACQSNGSLEDTYKVASKADDELVDEKGSHHQDIYKFASKADIVVCCLLLNKQTVGIVNKAFMSSMKKGALLVNIARGGIVDYDALFDCLESGHLGGLGTDVAWTEPINPDDPILKFNNVIITPHVAGLTEHSNRLMAKVVGDVAIQIHKGANLTGIEFVN